MKKLILLVGFIFIASACSFYQIESDSVNFTSHPKKLSKDQVVYLKNIDRPHEIIGHITVNVERRQKISEVLDKLKTEAAVLGGDAITNISTNAGTGKWAHIKPKKLFGNANIRINYVADVAVFKDAQENAASQNEAAEDLGADQGDQTENLK